MMGDRPARAQGVESEASVRFRDGIRLMTQGVRDHDPGVLAQACAAFEASNQVEPRAGTLLQLANCRELSQQYGSAWAAYQEAMTRATDPRKRAFAADKLAQLEARLSHVTIVVADHPLAGLTVTLDGAPLEPAMWNHPVPVNGGDHVITSSAPGHDDWQTTAHVVTEHDQVRVELPALAVTAPGRDDWQPIAHAAPPRTPAQPKPAAPVPPARSTPAPEAAPDALTAADHAAVVHMAIAPARAIDHGTRTAPSSRFTTRRKVALGVAGAGAAIAVVGLVVGASANSKLDDARHLCPEMTCLAADQSNALIQSAHHRALGANIAFGVAAAGAVGAGLLWFTGAPSAESAHRISVAPSIAPGETRIVVMGRF